MGFNEAALTSTKISFGFKEGFSISLMDILSLISPYLLVVLSYQLYFIVNYLFLSSF
jgi:hypothetical protein